MLTRDLHVPQSGTQVPVALGNSGVRGAVVQRMNRSRIWGQRSRAGTGTETVEFEAFKFNKHTNCISCGTMLAKSQA
jgi:hypothetical protein